MLLHNDKPLCQLLFQHYILSCHFVVFVVYNSDITFNFTFYILHLFALHNTLLNNTLRYSNKV